MDSSTSLESPLFSWHIEAGAKLADFGGWQMPIEYPKEIGAIPAGGVLAEHAAVREKVGVFDVSHLGKISVEGDGALEFLNSIFTNDLTKIGDGAAQYNLLCNDTGGVIDDLIIYRYSSDKFLLVPNAANCAAVYEVLVSANTNGLKIVNEHRNFGVLAIQGPHSADVLKELGITVDLDYMSFTEIDGVVICRTGYTGEFGFELLPPWSDAQAWWNRMVAAVARLGGQVCGLGARDTLRTEMGYPLHGHELSLSITPLEANAAWAVALTKPAMHGGAKLIEQKAAGLPRISRGIKSLDRGIPRGEMILKNAAGDEVGVVTSGTFSPTLRVGIGLALLNKAFESDINYGSTLFLDVRGRISEVEVVKVPLVPSRVR